MATHEQVKNILENMEPVRLVAFHNKYVQEDVVGGYSSDDTIYPMWHFNTFCEEHHMTYADVMYATRNTIEFNIEHDYFWYDTYWDRFHSDNLDIDFEETPIDIDGLADWILDTWDEDAINDLLKEDGDNE